MLHVHKHCRDYVFMLLSVVTLIYDKILRSILLKVDVIGVQI